jgi:ammonium transporter, Amt family
MKRARLDEGDADTLIPRSVIMTKRRVAVALLVLVVGLPAAVLWPAPSNAAAAEQAGAPGQAEESLPTAPVAITPERPVDAVFMIVCAGMAMLMIPALGLFYGGMLRRKNVLAAFQQSFIVLGVVTVQWVTAGYSLTFGPDAFAGICGGGRWLGLWQVGLAPNAEVAPLVPHQLFMIYQLMVAVLTAALISGAIAERMRFSSYVVFSLLWTTVVYDPVAHWMWGPGGWLAGLGAIDFGGGLVVHLTSGLAALCCALFVGKRTGLDTEDMHPHNLTLTALATGLLWYGWLGLNAGQARGANAAAVSSFVSTNLAGAVAMVTWGAVELIRKRKVTLLGACTGAIAGLVAVSPAAGYITPTGALLIGLAAGPLCYAAIALKGRLGYDDSLDVFGVHGVGALFGVLAVGVLARSELAGRGGLVDGTADLLLAQTIAILAVGAYTVVITVILLVVIDRTLGLRVSAEEEDLGLDLTQHGQRGYIMGEGELIGLGPR